MWKEHRRKIIKRRLCSYYDATRSFVDEIVFSKRKTMTASSVAIMNSGRIRNDGNSGTT